MEHSSKNETDSNYERGEIHESSIFSDFDKSNSGKISLGSLQVSICHPPALDDYNLTCVGRYEEGRREPHGRGDGGHHQQTRQYIWLHRHQGELTQDEIMDMDSVCRSFVTSCKRQQERMMMKLDTRKHSGNTFWSYERKSFLSELLPKMKKDAFIPMRSSLF